MQAGPFRGSGPTFANSTRSLAEDFAKPLHAACEQRSGRVHNETFNEDSRCKRQLRWPASRRVIPATSRVHGSVEVLQSVLLLLLSSLQERERAHSVGPQLEGPNGRGGAGVGSKQSSRGRQSVPEPAQVGAVRTGTPQSPFPPLPYLFCAPHKHHHQWAAHGGTGGRSLSGKDRVLFVPVGRPTPPPTLL